MHAAPRPRRFRRTADRARFRQSPVRRFIPPVQIESSGEAISISDKVFEAILIAVILAGIARYTGLKIK